MMTPRLTLNLTGVTPDTDIMAILFRQYDGEILEIPVVERHIDTHKTNVKGNSIIGEEEYVFDIQTVYNESNEHLSSQFFDFDELLDATMSIEFIVIDLQEVSLRELDGLEFELPVASAKIELSLTHPIVTTSSATRSIDITKISVLTEEYI